MPRNSDIVASLRTPDGKGRWKLQYDGGIITEGNAPFFGSYPGLPAEAKMDDDNHRGFFIIEPWNDGYQVTSTDGGDYAFDSAVWARLREGWPHS